jgi:hypothetical protein
MSGRPTNPAKDVVGNSSVFTDFMRRLMQVPHSEIKAKLEAEKAGKRTRSNKSASPAAVSSASKAATSA